MFDQRDIDELNNNIAGWNNDTTSDVRNEIDSLGIKHYPYSRNTKSLKQAFRSSLRKRFDLTDRINYSIPQSGIFVHKGVSRGHGKDNPRKAKEFFNPVIDRNLDKLANIVADGQGTLVINALNIK
jgi:hypothetical protein